LAPPGFWLLQQWKMLKGTHFSFSAEVEAAVRKWISIQLKNFSMNKVKNG
jgi:hypothetical protein